MRVHWDAISLAHNSEIHAQTLTWGCISFPIHLHVDCGVEH